MALINMALFALLAIGLAVINNVQALTFVEIVIGCTNNNDGLLTSSIFLASANCMVFGSTSIDNGCKTGTFTSYNSTDCTGDVIATIPRDTCTTIDSSKMIYRCSSYNDAEYLRQTTFLLENGHGAHNCNSTLKVASFSRLGFCYPGNEVGFMGFKYERANATAVHGRVYNDANCNALNHTQDLRADGVCQGSFQTDFVTADQLGNSATIIGRSTGLMIVASMLVTGLLL